MQLVWTSSPARSRGWDIWPARDTHPNDKKMKLHVYNLFTVDGWNPAAKKEVADPIVYNNFSCISAGNQGVSAITSCLFLFSSLKKFHEARPAKLITPACSADLGTSRRRTLVTKFWCWRKKRRKQRKQSLVTVESNQGSQGVEGVKLHKWHRIYSQTPTRWYGGENIFRKHPNFEQHAEPIEGIVTTRMWCSFNEKLCLMSIGCSRGTRDGYVQTLSQT